MATEYALDVAFSSTTVAANPETPMVPAFGFGSLLMGGTWSEDGQKVEKVEGGAEFFFAAFDTAQKAGTVSQMQFDFGVPGSRTPFVNKKGDPLLSPIVVGVGEGLTFVGDSERSPGCNVIGAKWLAGPYTITSLKGTYECTVTVDLEDSGGNPKEFSVDPEIQVEGPGPDPGGS
jgi:hypothetical protein